MSLFVCGPGCAEGARPCSLRDAGYREGSPPRPGRCYFQRRWEQGARLCIGCDPAAAARKVFAFLAGLSAVLGLLFVLSGHQSSLIAIVAAWGFVHSAGFLLGQSIVARVATEAPGFGNALFAPIGNAGVAAGTTLGGVVIATLGVANPPLTTICLLGLAGIAFAVALQVEARRLRAAQDPHRSTADLAPPDDKTTGWAGQCPRPARRFCSDFQGRTAISTSAPIPQSPATHPKKFRQLSKSPPPHPFPL
ncbi:MAG: MFS transporter [Pseudomonadota bacterium]